MKLWMFLSAAAVGVTAIMAGLKKMTAEAPAEEEGAENPANEPEAPTETLRAVIESARRDLDPATLQGWSYVAFRCEDGETRKMSFPGDNGVHLVKGESGLLEHRNGAFVSFEKDSGEVVAPLYHIPAEEGECDA